MLRDIRLPVTGLDKYRYWREHPTKTTEDYLRDVLVRESTPAMQAGIAFEDAIMASFGFGKDRPRVSITGAIELQRPAAVQMWVSKRYVIGRFNVKLLGKVDAVRGSTVIDWKTSKYTIDAARYLDAFQWRCYLDALPGYDAFRYEVFQIYYRGGTQNLNINVSEQMAFECVRYPELSQDVHDALAGWLAFLEELEREEWIVLTARGIAAGPRVKGSDWLPLERRPD